MRAGNIIEELRRTITRLLPKRSTCQLFTGHLGGGKSTELLRLKSKLEQDKYHVIYFDISKVVNMDDVDVSEILLAVTSAVSENLRSIDIDLRPPYLAQLFDEIKSILKMDLNVEVDYQWGMFKLTSQAKGSKQIRDRVRQYLEPRTSNILETINEAVLQPAIQKLQEEKGKPGLVVILDGLDRIDNDRRLPLGRTLAEHLFIDRGEQLCGLHCHLVYTIPLGLVYSNNKPFLIDRLGGGLAPRVLPIVSVQLRNGDDCQEGISLLKQLVLARAFPEVEEEKRLELMGEVFDSPETLDRLCRISGGHVRTLVRMLFSCLRKKEQLPLSRDCLESVIVSELYSSILGITSEEWWDKLFRVAEQNNMVVDIEYQKMLHSLYILEYWDQKGGWFDINPLLKETEIFKSWQQHKMRG